LHGIADATNMHDLNVTGALHIPVWLIAFLVKPLVLLVVFVLIVAPATWALAKVIPNGRIKQILFKDRKGQRAGARDKAIIGFYVALFVIVAWMGFLR